MRIDFAQCCVDFDQSCPTTLCEALLWIAEHNGRLIRVQAKRGHTRFRIEVFYDRKNYAMERAWTNKRQADWGSHSFYIEIIEPIVFALHHEIYGHLDPRNEAPEV